jgi:hypothetical protein
VRRAVVRFANPTDADAYCGYATEVQRQRPPRREASTGGEPQMKPSTATTNQRQEPLLAVMAELQTKIAVEQFKDR